MSQRLYGVDAILFELLHVHSGNAKLLRQLSRQQDKALCGVNVFSKRSGVLPAASLSA